MSSLESEVVWSSERTQAVSESTDGGLGRRLYDLVTGTAPGRSYEDELGCLTCLTS